MIKLALTYDNPYFSSVLKAIIDDCNLFLHQLNMIMVFGSVNSHNITQPMRCVHGPSSIFKNKDSGYWNPTTSN